MSEKINVVEETTEVVTEEVTEVNDEVTYVSTKVAFRSIGHNAIVKAGETWTKWKPRLEKAVMAVAVIGGVAYAYDKMTSDPKLEKNDDWTDDNFVESERTDGIDQMGLNELDAESKSETVVTDGSESV